MIQVNIFDCSGIAIGLCLSHKIVDGISTSAFLKVWAASARGSSQHVYPNFNAASLFRPNDQLPTDSIAVLGRSLIKTGKCLTRRFLFDASAIAALKNKATVGSGMCCPSSVEVVSAFIWKCSMSASEANLGFRTPSLISHAVDLRRRMVPPLQEYSVGNLLWIPSSQLTTEDDLDLPFLVGKVRETIKRIDTDLVRKLQGVDGLSVICEHIKGVEEMSCKDRVQYYGFTSWSKFGIYETDFGWRKPIWVISHGIIGSVFMNLFHMLETRGGDGIEASVTLDEDEMGIFLRDQEFLSFVSVDPSPLNSATLPVSHDS